MGPVHSYVGLRADEPTREGGDYRSVPGVEMVCPMRDWGWSLAHVIGYLMERQVIIPRRTDCARCYHQTLHEWWMLWREAPTIYADAEMDESNTGHTFRSPSRDTQPAALRDLRLKFEAGYVPAQRKRATQCRVCAA
jgi:hypothetical protein